ncbi:hypothetical protein ACWD8I_22230, partial [Micromonospora arida]
AVITALVVFVGRLDDGLPRSELAAMLVDEQRRLSLAKAGFDRAKEFTWESSAEVHIAAWSRARS